VFSHRWPSPPDAGLASDDGAGFGGHWPRRRGNVGVRGTRLSASVVGTGRALELSDASLWYPNVSALSVPPWSPPRTAGHHSPADPLDSSAELALLGTGRLLSILVLAAGCAFIVNPVTLVLMIVGLLTDAVRCCPLPQGRCLCGCVAWLRGPLSKLAAWSEGYGDVGMSVTGGEGRETDGAR